MYKLLEIFARIIEKIKNQRNEKNEAHKEQKNKLMQRVYGTPKQSPTCETKLGNFQEIRKNIRKQGKISTYISIFLFYENVYNTRFLTLINYIH